MRREGSAFQGLGAVVLKELSDHLTSVRMRVLEWLVVLVAIAALWGAIQQIKETTAEDPFLFLRLFTTSREPLPSFVSFISFLVPLMAIGLGFDAVNSEYTRRTLSRILSQPIYRDALLFGKFIAGLMTLAISLITLWLLVVGLGLVLVGIPPGAEEISRSFLLLLVTIIYAGVWLALAMLFSILFRSAATAALVTLGLWLLITFIWPVLAGAVAQIIAPPDPRYMALGLQTPATVQLEQFLARLSPSTLFGEVVVALLDPTTRSLGPIYLSQMQGAVLGAPLPIGESMLDRVAADGRHGRNRHPPLRHRLRDFPAAGSARLTARPIFRATMKTRAARGPPSLICGSPGRLDRQNRDDPHVARIDDDQFILVDEIEETAPCRLDIHEHPRHRDDVDAATWNDRPHRQVEVDVADPRRAVRADDRLPDLRALFVREGDMGGIALQALQAVAPRPVFGDGGAGGARASCRHASFLLGLSGAAPFKVALLAAVDLLGLPSRRGRADALQRG